MLVNLLPHSYAIVQKVLIYLPAHLSSIFLSMASSYLHFHSLSLLHVRPQYNGGLLFFKIKKQDWIGVIVKNTVFIVSWTGEGNVLSLCTSAWEHLDSVTLSTLSRATITPSHLTHLISSQPAEKKKKRKHRSSTLELHINLTLTMNNRKEEEKQRLTWKAVNRCGRVCGQSVLSPMLTGRVKDGVECIFTIL